MLTRREFLKLSLLAGAGLFVHTKLGFVQHVLAAIPGGTLDPLLVPKYIDPLVIPPAMPRTKVLTQNGEKIDYYEIAIRQFIQNILPVSMNRPTTVWSYGSETTRGTFNYPAFTIEATQGKPVQVKWINKLVDSQGNFLPHLLPVDPTLHWANPPGPRDERPTFSTTPGRYTGPVPMVTHLHGGHTAEESDGYAEAWYLPVANNIPAGFFTEGSFYDPLKAKFADKFGLQWGSGFATFRYENDERPSTLWYHDHTLGMTRLNVYAGPAGFYNIRGGASDLPVGVLPGPAPALGDPAGKKYYEIPIAIQDRSFNSDGSLFYPDTRDFFDGYTGPFIPDTPVSPIWNPEFFGNTIVVNGRTWPVINVEARRYRFRLLNGCQSRTLVLKLVADPLASRPASPVLPFWQIGSDGGFLPAPVQQSELLMGNAYRADVIVDFTGLAGTEIFLINEGPDFPYNGPVDPADMSDPFTTGQVMKFVVTAPSGPDTSTPPSALTLPAFTNLAPEERTRQVALMEEEFMGMPTAALLGVLDANNQPVAKMWADPITESPPLGAMETWEIKNYTVDAHPIHVHEIQMQLVNRQPFDPVTGQPTGAIRGPTPGEDGFKDTFLALPGEITRIKAKFDLPGQYVWHCHIVEHEDNEMMRPYFIDKTAGFPRAPVLDDFNRPDGKINSGWKGDVTRFRITNQAAEVLQEGGVLYWNPQVFSVNQEAYFTFTNVGAQSNEQGVILKLNGGKPTSSTATFIEVFYDALVGQVNIGTRDRSRGWIIRAIFDGISFAPGDQLGARALADGEVIAFKNGAALGSTHVTAGAFPWPAALVKGGGRLGVWFRAPKDVVFEGSNAAGFDNFGGGNM